MSTLKTSNIQHASAASAAITLDANGQATLNGLAYPTSGSLSGRNRIINGDMRISQAQAGASISVSTDPSPRNFPVDRFFCSAAGGGVYTAQRSTTAPAGFTNSLALTVTTADSSIAAGDVYYMCQAIEGFNVGDLGWGSASAQTITLSFWVRSSVTGTYSGALRNNAVNRAYAFSYTINSANTWEQKAVTVAGDTSGTWTTDNSSGILVDWDLGSGTNFNGTANAWSAGNFLRNSSGTNWIANSGATFYITGVQLEAGSVATPFEHRSYGDELARCQRYAYKLTDALLGININASDLYYPVLKHPHQMRSNPTLESGASFNVSTGSAGTPAISNGRFVGVDGKNQVAIFNNDNNWSTGWIAFTGVITAEL